MVSAGSGNSSNDRSYASLEQLLSEGSNDIGCGVQLDLQRLTVKAPTVSAVALKRQMLVYIEKAGMISPPFEAPMEIKSTLLEHQWSGPGVLEEQQQWQQQQPQQLGLIRKAASVQVSRCDCAKCGSLLVVSKSYVVPRSAVGFLVGGIVGTCLVMNTKCNIIMQHHQNLTQGLTLLHPVHESFEGKSCLLSASKLADAHTDKSVPYESPSHPQAGGPHAGL